MAEALALVSPIVLALGLGAVAGPILRRGATETGPGIELAGSGFLRAGVALLGLQVSLADVAKLGGAGVLVAAGTIAATVVGTVYLGRWLRVDAKLSLLISAGTGICGASAIVALNEVVKARPEQVSYAVGTVTVLGTAALVAIPVVGGSVLSLDDELCALWVGASVHEVAQVAAAAAVISPSAVATAALMKLTRVALLGPTVAAVALWRNRSGAALELPLFLYAFFVLVLLHSVIALPPWVLDAARVASALLLTSALAALGAQLRLRALSAVGPRPLLLAVLVSILAAVFSLCLLVLLGDATGA